MTDFENLLDAMDAGGIEISVYFCPFGNKVLFRFSNGAMPSESALAAAAETASRFKTEAAFRESVENYGVSIGAAVHDVDKPAWVFQPADGPPPLSVVN